MDPDSVSKAFMEHFFSTFDTSRANLGHVHVDLRRSEVPRGPEHCRQARSLPFEQYKHNISIVDFQPSGPAGGMLVFVNDNFQLAGEQHALKFSQMFDLMPTPQGSFYFPPCVYGSEFFLVVIG
ncbi:hypothetical protein G4B88_014393 [Cannabis sativa]|uniref:NTF2 domain-containing protein n=1 Tax=Cannabis sativa TaxID=3483 RepID=A0A7J6I8S3_CANSA|nr:hypothetical protein G4B88_014393 [Cannabis sativa]